MLHPPNTAPVTTDPPRGGGAFITKIPSGQHHGPTQHQVDSTMTQNTVAFSAESEGPNQRSTHSWVPQVGTGRHCQKARNAHSGLTRPSQRPPPPSQPSQSPYWFSPEVHLSRGFPTYSKKDGKTTGLGPRQDHFPPVRAKTD